MWGAGVARVAEPADLLTAPDIVALLYLDAAWLEVGVYGIPAATDVGDHVVAWGVLQRQVGVPRAGLEVGVLVHGLHDPAVGHRDNRPAVGGVVSEPGGLAGQ